MALWSRESVSLWPSRARCTGMSGWLGWRSRMAPRSAARCPWARERRPPHPSRPPRPSKLSRHRSRFQSPSRSSRPTWRTWRLRKALRRPSSRLLRQLRWPSCEWPARTAGANREQRGRDYFFLAAAFLALATFGGMARVNASAAVIHGLVAAGLALQLVGTIT